MFIAKYRKRIRILCWFFFCIYLAALVYFLFFAEMLGRTGAGRTYQYNLILFREIGRFWTYRGQLGMSALFFNLAGNILIFVPFGFFLPLMARRMRHFFQVLLLSLELSLIVEAVQLITKTGSFDVDDLLLNTIGGAIGYGVCMIVRRRRDRLADDRRRKEGREKHGK